MSHEASTTRDACRPHSRDRPDEGCRPRSLCSDPDRLGVNGSTHRRHPATGCDSPHPDQGGRQDEAAVSVRRPRPRRATAPSLRRCGSSVTSRRRGGRDGASIDPGKLVVSVLAPLRRGERTADDLVDPSARPRRPTSKARAAPFHPGRGDLLRHRRITRGPGADANQTPSERPTRRRTAADPRRAQRARPAVATCRPCSLASPLPVLQTAHRPQQVTPTGLTLGRRGVSSSGRTHDDPAVCDTCRGASPSFPMGSCPHASHASAEAWPVPGAWLAKRPWVPGDGMTHLPGPITDGRWSWC